MDLKELQKIMNDILERGPSRVVINHEGEAKPPNVAQSMGVKPTVIFIKKDGWSLGAPGHLREVAYEMWKDEWIGFTEIRWTHVRDIDAFEL